MALQDFIFRTITKAGYTTKGSELTWTELDENFEVLIDELANSNSGAVGNIAPYNPSTTYDNTNPTYVSYLGNIYQYISGTPSAGNTPSTSPTFWQVVSSGVLTHQQNTDLALAKGTANEVTASSLALHLIDHYKTTTLAGLITLKNSNQLNPAYQYYLTDKQIALFATTTNNVSPYGAGYFYNADYQNASGQMLCDMSNDSIWGDSSSDWWTSIVAAFPTPASRIGKKVIYAGKHYESITGLNTALSPLADTTNWLTLPANHNSYRTEVDAIEYDIINDVIMMRADRRGNVVYTPYPYTTDPSYLFQFGNNAVRGNFIQGTTAYLVGNRGAFVANHLSGAGTIIVNSGNNGNIYGCTIRNSTITFAHESSIEQCIFTNVNGVSISNFAGDDLIDCSYDTHFSFLVGTPTNACILRPNYSNIQRTLLSNSSDNFINLDYDSVHYHENTTGSMTIDYINSQMEQTMQMIQVQAGFDLTINYGTGNILSHDGSVSDFLDGTSAHWLVGFKTYNDYFVVVNVYN